MIPDLLQPILDFTGLDLLTFLLFVGVILVLIITLRS